MNDGLESEVNECPHPEKVAFASYKTARRTAYNRAMACYRDGRHFPGVYGYRCDCGMIHLTSRSRWNGKRLVLLARIRPARILAERAYDYGRNYAELRELIAS